MFYIAFFGPVTKRFMPSCNVTGRASVLHLFSKLLEIGTDGKNEYEKTLHKLIFPMRSEESKDKKAFSVQGDNLWIFDEKFAYYDYIASDLQLKQHKPLSDASQSEERPDVSIYFFSDDSTRRPSSLL